MHLSDAMELEILSEARDKRIKLNTQKIDEDNL